MYVVEQRSCGRGYRLPGIQADDRFDMQSCPLPSIV